MRVLAISGSLRRDSHNTALLRTLAEEAPRGVEVEVWDGLRSIPPYDADDDTAPGPAAVEAFRDLVREADAVFFATPEYNSSIPGALKNALDWASRPLATNVFRGKPVAVVGSSTGAFGAVWAAAELRKVLAAMGARVTAAELAVPHAHEGPDVREGLRDALDTLLAELSPVSAAA
jgi:chromate reductase